VAISLNETTHLFAAVLCGEQIITTGMILQARMKGEESRQNYWFVLDFDWNVFEDEELAWPGIW
jgi:hypothetical protein